MNMMPSEIDTLKKILKIIKSHYDEKFVQATFFEYTWDDKKHAVLEISISFDDPRWRRHHKQILEIISRHTQKNSSIQKRETFSEDGIRITLEI